MFVNVETNILATGLAFPEAPRWRDGKLWFSDFYHEKIFRFDHDTGLEEVVCVPGQPSGLGWDINGNLLVVSMIQKKLFCFDGRILHELADMSEFAMGKCNDMVVSERGDCYVGECGFDFRSEAPKNAKIIKVASNGHVSVAVNDMRFPNGSAIIDNGKTLIVAETMGGRLSAFTIEEDGSLTDKRIWADIGGFFPDGIAVDGLGGVWIATPHARQVIRIDADRKISHRVALERDAFACAVGGMASDTLYICTSVRNNKEECLEYKWGRIESLDLTKIL